MAAKSPEEIQQEENYANDPQVIRERNLFDAEQAVDRLEPDQVQDLLNRMTRPKGRTR